MEQEDKWMRFAATGKISDYLDYRSSENVNLDGKFSGLSENRAGDFDTKDNNSEAFGSNKVR